MSFIEAFARLRICPFHYAFCRNLAKLVIKENGREQKLTGTEVAKKITKESEPGLEEGHKTVLNNIVKKSERVLEKGGGTWQE